MDLYGSIVLLFGVFAVVAHVATKHFDSLRKIRLFLYTELSLLLVLATMSFVQKNIVLALLWVVGFSYCGYGFVATIWPSCEASKEEQKERFIGWKMFTILIDSVFFAGLYMMTKNVWVVLVALVLSSFSYIDAIVGTHYFQREKENEE